MSIKTVFELQPIYSIPFSGAFFDIASDIGNLRFALATREENGPVFLRLYCAEEGKSAWRLEILWQTSKPVTAIGLRPDGFEIVLVDEQSTLTLLHYDKDSTRIKTVWMQRFQVPLGHIALSPEHIAITIPSTGEVILLSYDGKREACLMISSIIRALRYSDDGKILGFGCEDGTVGIISEDGVIMRKERLDGPVCSVYPENRGEWLLVGLEDGHFILSDLFSVKSIIVTQIPKIMGIFRLSGNNQNLIWSSNTLGLIQNGTLTGVVSTSGAIKNIIGTDADGRPLVVIVGEDLVHLELVAVKIPEPIPQSVSSPYEKESALATPFHPEEAKVKQDPPQEDKKYRCFVMPGRSRAIEDCCNSLIFYNILQKTIDADYSLKHGDIGFLYDTGADELIGVFEARSAPQIQPLPPNLRSERISHSTKNALAIPLNSLGSHVVVPDAGALLSSIGLTLQTTRTGEVYFFHPTLEGDPAQTLLAVFGLADPVISYPTVGTPVWIVDGDLKNRGAVVKGIDRTTDSVVIELCEVFNPVPIPLPRTAIEPDNRYGPRHRTRRS